MDTQPWNKQKTEREDPLLKCSQLYVLMWLNPAWLDDKDILAVNGYGQISFNYGDWHGKAEYEWNDIIGGIWHMDFKTNGSRGEMTKHFYRQVLRVDEFNVPVEVTALVRDLILEIEPDRLIVGMEPIFCHPH